MLSPQTEDTHTHTIDKYKCTLSAGTHHRARNLCWES